MNQVEFNALAAEFQSRVDARIKKAQSELFRPKDGYVVTKELIEEFGTPTAVHQYIAKIGHMNGEKVEKVTGFVEAADQMLYFIAIQHGLEYKSIRYQPPSLG